MTNEQILGLQLHLTLGDLATQSSKLLASETERARLEGLIFSGDQAALEVERLRIADHRAKKQTEALLAKVAG